jgi:hypothetical protein
MFACVCGIHVCNNDGCGMVMDWDIVSLRGGYPPKITLLASNINFLFCVLICALGYFISTNNHRNIQIKLQIPKICTLLRYLGKVIMTKSFFTGHFRKMAFFEFKNEI